MSQWRPKWRLSERRGTRRGGSRIGATPEGDQALQILHDRSQGRLTFDPLSPSPASSSEAVFILAGLTAGLLLAGVVFFPRSLNHARCTGNLAQY